MILLMYCWIWFASILLRILHLYFIREIDLKFSCGIFVRFLYQGNAVHIKCRSVPSSSICEEFVRISIDSLDIWQNSPVKSTRSGIFGFGEIFDYQFNLPTSNQSVQSFYFSWFSLGRLYVSRNFSISSRVSIFCHRVACSSLLGCFVFLWCLL